MINKALASMRKPMSFLGVSTFAILALFQLTRLDIFLKELVQTPEKETLWRILFQSLRFDIMVAASVWIGFFVLVFLVGFLPQRLALLRAKIPAGYLALLCSLMFFFEAATPSFFEEYGLRPNRLFFEYLGHPVEVAKTIASQVGLYVIPILILPVLVFYFVYGWTKYKVTNISLKSWLMTFLILLPFLSLAARWRLTDKPLSIGDANITENSRINELTLNSTLSLATAIYMLRFEEDSGQTYDLSLPYEEVLKIVKKESLIPPSAFLNLPKSPLTYITKTHAERSKPLNLVIILEESLGADYVGILGGLPLTPNFDKWSQKGMLFSKLYSTGTRSANGIEAIISGFLPTPGKSVIKLGLAQHNFFTIAALLRDHGYFTSFQYGGDANFDNMQTFSLNNGFEEVLDQRHFLNPKFVGTWGMSDEDLFDRAHNWLETHTKEPVFSVIFTSSNHGPFEFPDGRIELYDPQKATVRNSIKYADFALGQFLEKASKSSYFENTIFLILADHNWRNYGGDLVPIDRMRIPALLIGPGILPSVYATPASQIDLIPTALPLLGFDFQSPLIGRDVLNLPQDTPGRAILQFGDHNAYLEGDRVIFTMPGGIQVQYRKVGEKLEKEAVDQDFARTALAHALLPSMVYKDRHYQYRFSQKRKADLQ